MTSTKFQQRFPKPWRVVTYGVTFSLRAANGAVVASIQLSANHSGIPQAEWNRHIADAMSEYLPISEGTPDHRANFGPRKSS